MIFQLFLTFLSLQIITAFRLGQRSLSNSLVSRPQRQHISLTMNAKGGIVPTGKTFLILNHHKKY